MCAGCGYVCAPDFAFCPQCGVAVAGVAQEAAADGAERTGATSTKARARAGARPPASPGAMSAAIEGRFQTHADRRPVTVLFADLSGFTTLSERLDPELVQTVQNELFDEMTAAVEAFGGFVDKFIGDAMLALFGAPAAHEDDPERALRAALDLIRRTARVSERLEARIQAPLTLHIGVNTGHVVAGAIGSGSARSYSVTGDTVNTAQRLQSMAAPGEVLVGPLTYRLTRHAFLYDALGEASLRGKSGSVLVHRLRGVLEAPRPARGLEAHGLIAPLIGRETELAHMVGCLDLACGGAAQLVRLIGEAGIGKTRLVAEFLTRIRDDERFTEVAVRQVACSPLGEQSYGALAAVLRSAYQIARTASPAQTQDRLAEALAELGLSADDIRELMPLYLHVLGLGDADGVLQHVKPEQLRRQIFFAIRTVFERRLALSPLLIIVEDLHWADAVSLEALRFVMDRLERTRLMLVFTHRPVADIDQFGGSRINQTARRLAPLSADEGKALLQALFGRAWTEQSARLCRRILDRSGGNPLFIEEIVRGLIEMEALKHDAAGWHIAVDETAMDIPAGIQALLLARMDRLPHDARALAQEAAVIGPRFEAALLKLVTADLAAVDQHLDVLCDAEVIEEMAGARSMPSRAYRFTQTLLHDVIYQNLLLQRRIDIHGVIGAALERLHGERPERLEDAVQLGHHFGLSADKQKGARYLRAAGDRARAIYANDDAMRLYQQALAILPPGEEGEDHCVLRERIADLCGSSGRRDVAEQHYQAVLARCRAMGDGAVAARILRKLGRLLWDGGKRSRAEDYYTEAARQLESVDAPVEQAHLLQERGHLAFRLGDNAAAVKWADDALGWANSVPARADRSAGFEAASAAAEALNTKGVALARLGRSRDAICEVERSVTVAEEADLPGAACRGYSNLGVLYTISDPQRAIDVCRRGLDVARRIGDLGFQARLLANLAVACCTFTARCDAEGVPAAEKAIEIDRALDQREHLPVSLTVLGQIYQCHGQEDLAVRCYSEALEVARDTGEPQQLFPCYDGLATLNLERGNVAEAERYFALAHGICARHGLDPEALIVLPFLD